MNILFTVCGRAGSKGFKNKNVQLFDGYPLSYYSLSSIDLYAKKHTGHIVDIALSTDSADLKEQVQNTHLRVLCIDRMEALCGDLVRKADVIRDAYVRASRYCGRRYDTVVDLDITSPLRRLRDIENVLEKREQTDADAVYTVTEARRSPYFNMVSKQGDYYDRAIPSHFATRQEAPELFDMNASIYAYSPSFLESTVPLFSRGDIVLMPDTGILDIDSGRDFVLLQAIASFLYKTDPCYGAIQAHIPNILGIGMEK